MDRGGAATGHGHLPSGDERPGPARRPLNVTVRQVAGHDYRVNAVTGADADPRGRDPSTRGE